MIQALTLVFTTIERPESAVRLLASIHAHAPGLKVHVLQQGRQKGLAQACKRFGAKLLKTDYDIGISAARNILIESVETPYVILAEDDMVFTVPPDFDRCVRLLENRPDIAGITGALRDVKLEGGDETDLSRPRHFTFAIDATGGGVILIPVQVSAPSTFSYEGKEFQYVDYGPQWGVFRMNFFRQHAVRWDERFKSAGEHLDFFLRLKLEHPGVKVVSYSGLICDHIDTTNARYTELRSRRDWVRAFQEKWGFSYFCQVGGAVRRYAAYYDGDVSIPDRRGMLLDRERERATKFRDQLVRLRERYEELKQKISQIKMGSKT